MAAALDEVAQRCSSTAMVYLMHLCGVACYAAAPDKTAHTCRRPPAASTSATLAFSERGSRSHFWAPVSRAAAANGGVRLNAQKSFVTSAGQADGYVVSTLAAECDAAGREHDLPRACAAIPASASPGLGRPRHARQRQRADDARQREGWRRSRADGPGKGLDMMLGVVLPAFQVGTAAVALGIAEAAVQATTQHLTRTRFEHLNSSLAELPTLRARLAQMRIETDRARAHLVSVLDSLEAPGPTTQLLVLEAKAAATEAAVDGHRPRDADVRRRRVRRRASVSSACFATRARRS